MISAFSSLLLYFFKVKILRILFLPFLLSLPRTGVHKYADGFGMNKSPSKTPSFWEFRVHGVSFGSKPKMKVSLFSGVFAPSYKVRTHLPQKHSFFVENLRFSPSVKISFSLLLARTAVPLYSDGFDSLEIFRNTASTAHRPISTYICTPSTGLCLFPCLAKNFVGMGELRFPLQNSHLLWLPARCDF